MAVLADIYVVDCIQSYLSEPIHNIFTFEKLEEGDSSALITAFREDIYPAMKAVQCEQIHWESIKAYSLGNLGDLDEYTMGTVGSITGADMLPIFNAVGFSLKPTGRTVRPGSKRIAGIPESVVTDGYVTDSSYITGLNGLRTALGTPITTAEENSWNLVIVKRIKYAVPDSDPVRYAYRYPETDEELVSQRLRNVTLNLKVTHQTSRGN